VLLAGFEPTHLCSTFVRPDHCATEMLGREKFPKPYFDIEIRIYTKLAQKEKHETLVNAN
jgi:hypothetical protein